VVLNSISKVIMLSLIFKEIVFALTALTLIGIHLNPCQFIFKSLLQKSQKSLEIAHPVAEMLLI